MLLGLVAEREVDERLGRRRCLARGRDRVLDQERVLRLDELEVFRARIRAEALPPEDLLDQIRSFGARVRMFQPEAMELETAFMKLTEGKTT